VGVPVFKGGGLATVPAVPAVAGRPETGLAAPAIAGDSLVPGCVPLEQLGAIAPIHASV
jgi:hypothetical protein